MHELPARALRQVPSYVDDDQGKDRADQEGEAPAEVGCDLVQEPERRGGADYRTGPIRAVHTDVDPASVARRDHLVDRGVDRSVFTADSGSSDDAGGIEEDHPASSSLSSGREATAHQVNGERDHE
jgi:hypothetical protein